MKTNEKKNTSAKKKLIPAVAMLTTSAVMLSTATYAWFTMNRDAEVTGLEMAATAGGGIEISLGQIGDENALGTITAPSMDNISWKSAVKLGEYYGTIGKLKPASSVNGNNLFYADDNGIRAGGKVVQDGTTVSEIKTNDEVGLNINANYSADGEKTVILDKNAVEPKSGRYLDIPMWIRTSKKEATTVSCEVNIDDATNGADKGVVDGEKLKNAVRVSIIPVGSANITTASNTNTLAISKAVAYGDTNANLNVYGLTFESYSKGTTNQGIKAASTQDNTEYSKLLGDITATPITVVSGETHTDVANVFTLSAANADSYSVQSFVVRVWLEGESIYCNDATASQDWNISLKFHDIAAIDAADAN